MFIDVILAYPIAQLRPGTTTNLTAHTGSKSMLLRTRKLLAAD